MYWMWSIGKGGKGICNSKAFILKWWWINFIIAQGLFQMLRPISQVLRCKEIQKGLMCFGENHDPCWLTTLENLIIKHGSWSEQEISNFKINGGVEVVSFDVICSVQCTTFGIFVSVVAFVEIVPVPSGLAPISHVPISWQSKWPIWRWHLVEHSPSILPAPTFCMYISRRLHPTKTLDSQPLWMICSWTFLPSSGATKPAHAFITSTKVNSLGLILSCCICWKSWITFLGCPSLTYFVSSLFHAKMFNCIVPGAKATLSAATHGGFLWSSSQSPSCIFKCVIQVPFICLQSAIQIKLIRHVFSPP